MNCLEFRREMLVNPARLGEQAEAHAHACPECRQHLERQRDFDARLYEALRVPVPDGIADRILVARGATGWRRRFLPWSLAASVLIVAGWFALQGRPAIDHALGREALAHVAAEPIAFTARETVPADFLPAALRDQGLQLARAVGEVTYAKLCPFDGRVARHVVIATTEGPVTLFLSPDDPNRRSRVLTEDGGMTALLRPARRGSVMIVAPQRTQAVALEQALLDVAPDRPILSLAH